MMKPVLKAALALAAGLSALGARADVLSFDDFSTSYGFILADYHGFTFGTNNIQTTAWFHQVNNPGDPDYISHSGTGYIATDYTLYTANPFGPTQAITNATPFVFNGAWFSGGDTITYQLFNGSTAVCASSVPTTTIATGSVTTWAPSGCLSAVTSVVVVGHQGFYAMDDFTYNAPVPETGTLAMFAAGLLGVAGVVRRRMR